MQCGNSSCKRAWAQQQSSAQSTRRLRINPATSIRAEKCRAQAVGSPEERASSQGRSVSFQFIAKVPGVQAVRVLSDEPWTSPQVLEIKRKGPAKTTGDQAKPSSSPAPTWRLWPLNSASGEVAGFVNLHLPVLDYGLVVKGVPSLRGSQGDKKVVDLYLFASNPIAHAAAARCAEQHWLQPLVAPSNHHQLHQEQHHHHLNQGDHHQLHQEELQQPLVAPSIHHQPHREHSQDQLHLQARLPQQQQQQQQQREQQQEHQSAIEQLLQGHQVPTGTCNDSSAQQSEHLDGRPPPQASVTEQLLPGNKIPTGARSSSALQSEQLDGRPPPQASVTEQLLLGDQIPRGTHSSSSTALQPEQLDEWVLEQSQFAHARLQDCRSDPELTRWAQLQLPQEHTFGVEVELLVWRDISQRGLQDMLESQACVAGWRVVRDGSINAPSRGCTAVEVISPVMQGMDGLAQIHRVMAVLASLPAAPNPSCALHVHVGKQGGWDHEHLKHLLHLFATYEPTLDLLVPTHRQGNNNQHCTSVAVPPSGGGGASEAAQRSQDTGSLMNAANPYGRTYKLNVRSLVQHGTVEFRHPGSSCSARAVCGFVALYLLLARAASVKAKAGNEGASLGIQQPADTVRQGPAIGASNRVSESSGDGDYGPVEGFQMEKGCATGESARSREQDADGEQLRLAGRGTGEAAEESLRKLAAELQAPSMLEWLLWQAAAVKPPVS